MFGRNKKKTESVTQLPQMTQAITPNDDFDEPLPAPKKAEKKWDDDVEFDSEDEVDEVEEELPQAPMPSPRPQTQRREPKVQENKVEQEIIAWIHATDKRLDQIERVIDSFAEDVNQRITNLESKIFRLKGVL